MGAESSDRLNIQAAPVMSDLQRWVLDNMLGGMKNLMGGFTLGAPYPGATPGGYNPLTFQFTNETPTYSNIMAGWPGATASAGTKAGPEASSGAKATPGAKASPSIAATPGAKPTPNATPTPAASPGATPGPGGPLPSPTVRASASPRAEPTLTSPFSPVPYVLGNVPKSDELLTNQLISPFVLPYLYGMTGNYPKKV
jgi:hypothetical protein